MEDHQNSVSQSWWGSETKWCSRSVDLPHLSSSYSPSFLNVFQAVQKEITLHSLSLPLNLSYSCDTTRKKCSWLILAIFFPLFHHHHNHQHYHHHQHRYHHNITTTTTITITITTIIISYNLLSVRSARGIGFGPGINIKPSTRIYFWILKITWYGLLVYHYFLYFGNEETKAMRS